MTSSTTQFQPYPVVRARDERGKPRGLIYGTGLAIRVFGDTTVEVQWPGVPGTRRESALDVAPYAEPTPTPVRRRRRAAA
jgi:hypothetical protein